MTTDQINYLNIGLMILSGIVAIFLPFELFLFSYAILGPLHYLTEISWLHKRQYFSPGKYDLWILAVLSMVILFPTLIRLYYNIAESADVTTSRLYQRALGVGGVMLFGSFATAAVLVFVKDTWARAIAILLVIGMGFLVMTQYFVALIFTLFIPTLIHVFVFTGLFILVGALKSKSISGILSLVAFVLCGVGLFMVNTHPVNSAGSYVLEVYNAGFLKLNRQLFAIFLHQDATNNDIIFSGPGILVTRFIAYAYTYHYLNWFSKTTVIKWHKVPRRSLVITLVAWLLAVVLYLSNYRVGLTVLYFLSILHVILEFPLNFQSFRDIGREFRKLILSRSN